MGGKEQKTSVYVLEGVGEYTWLLIHSGQIVRNMLTLAKESLEDRWSPRGESCLKNEQTAVER